ncbi:MAG: Mu transposase domain-containing protein [Collinsella sp.]
MPDNCKTGVIKNTVEELVVNEQYRLMCEHYGVGCRAGTGSQAKGQGRCRDERWRGGVERSSPPCATGVFIGIAELAAAIDEAVDSINSAPFQKRAGSRREAFLGREKDRLQPLPPTHYEMTVRKTATVQFNYHVSFDKRYYSVPAAYVRREVGIVATRTTVAVICDGERIAMHRRSTSPAGAYVTDPAHMPDSHREWTACERGQAVPQLGGGEGGGHPRRRGRGYLGSRKVGAAGLPLSAGASRPCRQARGRAS